MQLVNIFALLLVVPYVCCLFDLGDKKKKDTCPTYTCLKSLVTDCKATLTKNDPPVILSDDCLCEVFEDILSKNLADFTPKEQKELLDKYSPLLCCAVETTGLAECGKNANGELELKIAEDLTKFSGGFGPKCIAELATGQLPTEIFNLDLLGDLKKQLEEVLTTCTEAAATETIDNGKLLTCMGDVLKAFNAACKKSDKDTFCPGKEATYTKN